MARSKPGARGTSNTTTTSPPPSSSSSSSSPPEPFTRASPILSGFLSRLDRRKIYIVHVDAHARSFKQQVFAIPLLTNIVLTAILLWRAYVALPLYLLILASTLDRKNKGVTGAGGGGASAGGAGGVTHGSALSADVRTILWRTANFIFDFLLWVLVVPWPRRFFFGGRDEIAPASGRKWPEGPWGWKWHVGFPDREVIVRVSRPLWWNPGSTEDEDERVLSSAQASTVSASSLSSLTEESNPIFRTRILPAINEAWMSRRSGYMFIDANWDLDFDAMIAAHREIKDRTSSLAIDDFKKTVILHTKEFGWVVWKVWEVDGLEEQDKMREEDGGLFRKGNDDHARGTQKEAGDLRRKMNAIKDKLASQGKEDLFYRWIEIIQYETSSPHKSPFETAKITSPSSSSKPSSSKLSPPPSKQAPTAEPKGTEEPPMTDEEQQRKREEMTRKVKQMFQSEGVDLEELWREVEGEVEREKS